MFVEVLRQLGGTFTRAEVQAVVELRPSTVDIYLSQLSASGRLERLGGGEFRLTDATGAAAVERAPGGSDSGTWTASERSTIGVLQQRLGQASLQEVVIWDVGRVTAFAADIELEHRVVIEAPTRLHGGPFHQTLHDWFTEANHVALHGLTRRGLAARLWSDRGEMWELVDVFIVARGTLDATISTSDGVRAPTVNRLLALAAASPEMAARVVPAMFRHPEFSLTESLAATPSTLAAARLGAAAALHHRASGPHAEVLEHGGPRGFAHSVAPVLDGLGDLGAAP